jgi:hypothetical protein
LSFHLLGELQPNCSEFQSGRIANSDCLLGLALAKAYYLIPAEEWNNTGFVRWRVWLHARCKQDFDTTSYKVRTISFNLPHSWLYRLISQGLYGKQQNSHVYLHQMWLIASLLLSNIMGPSRQAQLCPVCNELQELIILNIFCGQHNNN